MKNTVQNLIRASVLCAAISASAAMADTTESTTSTTTTTSGGTVTTFTPNNFVVTDGTTGPATYTYSKTTTYVDQNGNPVSMETVHSGVPVTVYYTRNGDQNVATKVMVRTAAPAVQVTPAPAPVQQSSTTTTTTRKTDDN